MTGPPPRRPLTPTPEETARRQKSCLAVSLLRWAVSSPTPAGAARGTRTFCLSRLGGHFPFHGYFADKTKSRSSAGFIVSTRTQTTANFRRGERLLQRPWRPIRPVWLLRRPFSRLLLWLFLLSGEQLPLRRACRGRRSPPRGRT